MLINDDPRAPWNNPMREDDPREPWNQPQYRDDPREPWNNPGSYREERGYGHYYEKRSYYEDERDW